MNHLLYRNVSRNDCLSIIEEEYSDKDIKHKPYLRSDDESITLVLPDLLDEEGILECNVPYVEYYHPQVESPYDEEILGFAAGEWKKGREIAEHLGLSDSTYFRNTILGNLVKEELLLKRKSGRG